ncbi:ATP-dependent helicase [Marinilactibacillus kalidii]|uniref:ATP-dependent helicase n=1 Tax=Marinilactibacillus kalidii TaxID=2820274 RepID=UPI001ABDB12D|nr:ATP-dependent helicase [Marinilactibacillus kalidii]
MDTSLKIITSKSILPSSTHLKITAGPGAGKTTLLTKHIKEIVKKSRKISGLRRVGCITHTNIAIETLRERLGLTLDYVEIATIHNFFYKHILKPYLWVLFEDFDFDFESIKGHEDILPSYSLIKDWANVTNQFYLISGSGENIKEIAQKLQKITWEINEEGHGTLCFPEEWQRKVGKYYIKEDTLLEYKKICWSKGKIHHDDVMYLSLKILEKSNRVVDILRAKFPYIMIDEFQDTGLIQNRIIKLIAEKETKIVAIGDACQSIYGFAGAKVKEFIDFDLSGIKNFKIEENNRSTVEIIKVLNHVSKDAKLNQYSPKSKTGKKPSLLIGDIHSAYKYSKTIISNNRLLTLAYRKNGINNLKYGIEAIDNDDLKLSILFDDDDRGRKIYYTIQSIEYGKENNYKEAINSMLKAYRKNLGFTDKEALKNLQRLINEYSNIENLTLMEYYNSYLCGFFDTQQKITRGKKVKLYNSNYYKDIASIVEIKETSNLFRTIHKSKGDEEDNILVIVENKKSFNETKELKFLLNPKINESEDDRVYFVALSRAKENLFVNIPSLSEDNKIILEKMNLFDFIYLNK